MRQGPGVAAACSGFSLSCLVYIHQCREGCREQVCRVCSKSWWLLLILYFESFVRNFPGIFGNQQQHYLDVIKRMLVQCMQDQENPSVKSSTASNFTTYCEASHELAWCCGFWFFFSLPSFSFYLSLWVWVRKGE